MSRLLIPHGASLIPSPYFLLPILLTWTDDRCWRLVFDGGKSEHRRTRWWVTPTGLVARLGTVPQKTDRHPRKFWIVAFYDSKFLGGVRVKRCGKSAPLGW